MSTKAPHTTNRRSHTAVEVLIANHDHARTEGLQRVARTCQVRFGLTGRTPDLRVTPGASHSLQPSTFNPHAVRGFKFLPCLMALLAIGTSARAASRPNILFILTEDQGPHMSFLGTPGVETPHMDSIARSGVYFREAFVAYPVCSCSKAAIYTGVHNHTNGLRGNTYNYFKPDARVTPAERNRPLARRLYIRDAYPTLIEKLRDAGYYTGVTQKLHVLPNKKFPYDEFRGHMNPQDVVDFTRRARQQGKPWFLLYNIGPPHRPFRDSDKVEIGVDPAAVKPPSFLPDTPVIRQDWAEYLDYCEVADVSVGEALEGLRLSGEEENTIVLFMGDHGPGFHRAKMALNDLGLRVPLAIKVPGIRGGRVSDALVSELDLMPTLLDFLRLAPPKAQHGLSLRPILENRPGAKAHDLIFAEIAHQAQQVDNGMQERSVYDGRYHLIYREGLGKPRTVNADLKNWRVWRNRSYAETVKQKDAFPLGFELLSQIDPQTLGGKPPKFELYNTKNDPDEIHNLAGDPKYRAHLERLRAALKKWIEETSDQAVSVETLMAD
jgi:N-sulfoglucosamine sulfohydrolase